jgi:hypothetical protein
MPGADASSHPAAIERFDTMSTNPVSAVATLVARGPLTVGGTVNLQTGRAVLRGGRLTLKHHQVAGHTSSNPPDLPDDCHVIGDLTG